VKEKNMPTYLKNIEIIGLHDRFDIKQSFDQNIQIIFGENGTSKTTLIQIIANALNSDYRCFFDLVFKQINIILNDDTILKLRKGDRDPNDGTYNSLIVKRSMRRELIILRERVDGENERKNWKRRGYGSLMPVTYFPAFRTIIEVWASVEENKGKYQLDETRKKEVTKFARNVFGKFVPELDYPSPLEIERGLINEMREAMHIVAQTDQKVLSTSFVDVFSQLSPGNEQSHHSLISPEDILDQIKLLSQEIANYPLQEESVLGAGIYQQLRDILQTSVRFHESDSKQISSQILSVYQSSLQKLVEIRKESFVKIRRYLEAVNQFLKDKELVIDVERGEYNQPFVGIKFNDGSLSRGFSSLSSGERQIVTLMYAATHMNQQKLLLIDEPEISLHVDWQRQFIKRISEQSPDCQVIICTHSPVIAGDYDDDYVTEINLMPTNQDLWIDDANDPDDFIDDENEFIEEEDNYLEDENQ
jgi:predicted ATPase